jgi:hypothetical protein
LSFVQSFPALVISALDSAARAELALGLLLRGPRSAGLCFRNEVAVRLGDAIGYSFEALLGTGEMINSFLIGRPSLLASSRETLRNPVPENGSRGFSVDAGGGCFSDEVIDYFLY